ncbi:hypothetical protein [Ancylobacter sp. SL191]|uniref:hypothetical protein n=1 Tax=Ancylobacter sp. SL191 TaxID=2995166 RepID=UPI00226E5B91|nr:hypothetical protein [Ancylobacter sp. SL191]WAC29246.1 hypothetical protein OU996_09565 [Ancylobacter sp. SL191]
MGIHVREHPNSVRRFEMIETTALRRRMERAVEALLAALDDMDGDPDLEDADPAEMDDFPEEDDPPGGDVVDEPHDADTFTDLIADQDAAELLQDELWFAERMDLTRNERRDASNATLQALAKVTGRSFGSLHCPMQNFQPTSKETRP